MGTWGSGPFDNDDAADWAWRLTPDADEAVVRATLAPAPGQRLPSEEVVVAAAEVVAAGIGQPHPELPDDVAAWVNERRDRPWRDLLPLAIAAVEVLISAEDDEDDTNLDAAADELEDLRRRLRRSSRPTGPPPS